MNTIKSSSDRWQYIDLLEFLGMLLVIMCHSPTYSFAWMEEGALAQFIHYYLRTILSTCVPLFFFANGYLLLNKELNLKKHIIKTIKIIILTGIWGIINILFLMPIENEYLSLKEVAVYLWTWHLGWINHLWYMGALVCIYVFFPLLKIAYDNNRKAFIYFVVVCAILTFGNKILNCVGTVISNLIGIHEGTISINWFNMFNPFGNIYGYTFVYFCVGGVAHEYVEKIRAITCKKNNILAIIIMIISCMGLYVTGITLSNIAGEAWDVVWNGYDTIFTFINVCIIFALCLSYKGNNKIIELVSKNTLGIYFVHEIFVHLAIKYIKAIPVFQNFVGSIIYALAIMFICTAVIQILNKIPLFRKLVKL